MFRKTRENISKIKTFYLSNEKKRNLKYMYSHRNVYDSNDVIASRYVLLSFLFSVFDGRRFRFFSFTPVRYADNFSNTNAEL